MGRGKAIIAWGFGLLLFVLHLDFWRVQRVELYLGWMPEELAYRAVWMLAAWLYLLYFTAQIWEDD